MKERLELGIILTMMEWDGFREFILPRMLPYVLVDQRLIRLII